MRISLNRFPAKTFLISIFFHLLILLFFIHIQYQNQAETKPAQYLSIPSYIYNESERAPSVTQKQAVHKPVKPDVETVSTSDINLAHPQSIMNMTQQFLQNQQLQSAVNPEEDEQPVLMIGDPNVEASPLIKLLGRALSAHFSYPKDEGYFGIRGRVIAKIILHPDGSISDAQIIESSHNHNFDAAALYAINQAPLARGVEKYITKPTQIVIGFLFN